MAESDPSNDRRTGRRGKVARLLDEYQLHGLGDELVKHWTAEDEDRMSLRKLAEFFNVRLLEAVLSRETLGMVDGEAENYYRLLTDDDVSVGSRLDAEHRLESAGIDVDRLRSDFVSRQAIHSYLTGERDVAYESTSMEPEERIESSFDSINRLRNRLSAVTERSISSLADGDLLRATDVRASVHVEVECTECGDRSPVREFFEAGGCACEPNSDPD